MKPPDAKCTSQWRKGRVTDVHSPNNLSVDGIPRHILDVRRVILPSESSEEDGSQEEVQEVEIGPRRSQRERRQPDWMQDYEIGSDGEGDD